MSSKKDHKKDRKFLFSNLLQWYAFKKEIELKYNSKKL